MDQYQSKESRQNGVVSAHRLFSASKNYLLNKPALTIDTACAMAWWTMDSFIHTHLCLFGGSFLECVASLW